MSKFIEVTAGTKVLINTEEILRRAIQRLSGRQGGLCDYPHTHNKA